MIYLEKYFEVSKLVLRSTSLYLLLDFMRCNQPRYKITKKNNNSFVWIGHKQTMKDRPRYHDNMLHLLQGKKGIERWYKNEGTYYADY